MESKISELMETLKYLNDQFHAQKSQMSNRHEMDILELNHEITRLHSLLQRKDCDTNTSTPLKSVASLEFGRNFN